MVGQQKRVQVAKYSAQRDTYAASLPSATAATVCRCVAERPRLAGGGRWLVVACCLRRAPKPVIPASTPQE